MSNADVDLLSPLFALLTSFVVGGGIAKLLESLPAWREYNPPANIKMLFVFVLTALVGGALVWIQQWLVPAYWSQMPDSLKIFILSIASFAVSQYAHINDKTVSRK